MGVAMEAICPTSVATCASLELCVLSNTVLKSQKTAAAIANPPIADSGPLAQTELVAGILEKIIPKAPNAVINDAITVGLKNDISVMPLWSKPASA